jgi:hypothetical protein
MLPQQPLDYLITFLIRMQSYRIPPIGDMVELQIIQTPEVYIMKVSYFIRNAMELNVPRSRGGFGSLAISTIIWKTVPSPNQPLILFLAKTKNHEAASLPNLVENLVKNWEVEASFKPDIQDWRTIDHSHYSFSVNGGPPQTAEHMLKVGTYNAIITPNEYYSPANSDFASSHKTFKRMMPTFAWEVLEVYSGPPLVAFKWRHWGEMKNDYVGFNEYALSPDMFAQH